MSNFFTGLADGLKTGYVLGTDMNEQRDKRLLREGLTTVMGAPADPNTPTVLAQAEQIGQMANLYAQHGDPEKAIELRSKAAEAKVKAAQEGIELSYRRGDLPGLVGWYNKFNNGVQADLREENGEWVIYHSPTGNPDAAQPWARGTQQALLKQLGQYLSPEMYQKLAGEEIEFLTKQANLRKAGLEGDKLGMQLGGQPVSYGERMRGLEYQRGILSDQRAVLESQMKQVDANLEVATKSGDWEAAQAALLARDQLQQQIYGFGMGLGQTASGQGGYTSQGTGKLHTRFNQLAPAIEAAAARYGVPTEALAGVLAQESSFNPQAVGDNGHSWGIGQFNRRGAAADFGLTQEQILAMPAEQQIGLVANFLRQKIEQAGGDVWGGVKRYNGGGDPNYVQNVQRRIEELRLAPSAGSGDQPQQPSRAARMAQGLTHKETEERGIKVGTPEQLEKMQQIVGDVADQILVEMGYTKGDTIPKAAIDEASAAALQYVNEQAARMQGIGSQPTAAPARISDEEMAARTVEYLRRLQQGGQ